MLKKMLKNERGLTLIELLAVVVILGIIAAIAVPAIGNVIANSKGNAVKSEVVNVFNSSKLYTSANGVPASGTLTATELDDNLENVNYLATGYSVKANVTPMTFSGSATIGKEKFTFLNATLADVNKINGNTRTGLPTTITLTDVTQ
ncbi:hypothetical protein HMPREF3291_23070 [Bacillus sp. HMSC76G11]|nr:hypothetical protein HMPREF3291_23070 [Bacillus sp. HMSC76G11]